MRRHFDESLLSIMIFLLCLGMIFLFWRSFLKNMNKYTYSKYLLMLLRKLRSEHKVNTFCFKGLSSPLHKLSLSGMLSLSLSAFPCFLWCHACQQSCTLSEVREGSSHIFHPLSVSDWMSALVGDWKDGRKESRQGEKEGGM